MGELMSNFPIAEEHLTHWAREQRVTNHCGWDRENIIHKIMKRNIVIPLNIDDMSDIDFTKARVTQHALDELTLLWPEYVYVVSKLYCEKWSVREVARRPLDGCDWSKSSVHRIKDRALSWLERNIDVYY
jgi:hypothetical protein